MKRVNAKWLVVIVGVGAMVATLVPDVDARGRGRGGAARSHGSVRQSGGRVAHTGGRSATVTRGAKVSTPRGTRTVARTGTVHGGAVHGRAVHGGAAVAHHRADHRDDVRDDVRDVHRRTRARHAVGHAIRTLPRGHRTVYVAGVPYYYNDGYYYVKRYSGWTTTYVVSAAPVGAVIDELPDYCSMVVVVGGRTYYSDGTVYYTRAYKAGEVSYILVQRP